MSRRAVKVLAGATAAGLALGGALVGWTLHEGSPSGLLARKGRLVSSAVRPAGENSTSQLYELSLRSSTGLDVTALLRVPRAGPPPYPGAVLVGGVKRGRRIATAAGLEGIARHALVVSPDYPMKPGREAWRGLNFLATALRLRPAVFDAVAQISLLLDYLESRSDVERRRLFLIGGSLGAEVVTVAGGVDARPAAVVALYGGGQLGWLVAHTLEHPDQRVPYSHWSALALGHGLAWLLLPLDPERYAPAISPRPFLMLNGSDDSLVPRSSALALYDAARPPKELIWVRSEHVQPSETQLIQEVAGIVTAWLTRRGLLPSDEPKERPR